MKRKAFDIELVNDATGPLLAELLQCPICLEAPMLPPLLQCKNGHMLCGDCRVKPSCALCPTCRAGPVRSRNLSLERLASESVSKVTCKFKTNGCQAAPHYNDAAEHSRVCEFGPFTCCRTDCTEMLPMDKGAIIIHFRQHHGNHCSPCLKTSFGFVVMLHPVGRSVGWADYCICDVDASKFVIHVTCADAHYHCCVQFIGSRSAAKSFICRLTLAQNSSSFQWTGNPTSISQDVKRCYNLGNCLSIKKSMIDHLIASCGGWQSLPIQVEVMSSGSFVPSALSITNECPGKFDLSLAQVRRLSEQNMERNQVDEPFLVSTVARLEKVQPLNEGHGLRHLTYLECWQPTGADHICQGLVDENGICAVCLVHGVADPRWNLRCLFSDETDKLWLNTFHDAAECVTAIQAESAYYLEHEEGRAALEAAVEARYLQQPFRLKLRAKTDLVEGSAKLGFACINAKSVEIDEFAGWT